MVAYLSRITIEPGKRSGKPCVRGIRITVNDVLGWLAGGMTEEEVLEEHPALDKADFPAVYAFVNNLTRSLRAKLGAESNARAARGRIQRSPRRVDSLDEQGKAPFAKEEYTTYYVRQRAG